MSKKYKTSKKNRNNYIYYPAEGSKITIIPGEAGVTEADIELLHSWDDAEVDQQRRHDYHIKKAGVQLEISDDGHRHNKNPMPVYTDILIDDENEASYQDRFLILTTAMESLLPQQLELFKKVYVNKRTNTDIAAEEGVTEAAIRNRLKKMHEKLRKFFS